MTAQHRNHTETMGAQILDIKLRFVLQRAKDVSVSADGVQRGHFKEGLVVFLGVAGKSVNPSLTPNEFGRDYRSSLVKAAEKITKLRTFPEVSDTQEFDASAIESGKIQPKSQKMNLSLLEVGGGLALISQFTLFADLTKGNRPGFAAALQPAVAEIIYNDAVAIFAQYVGQALVTGVFGADMNIEFVNCGPVTYIFDVSNGKIESL